MSAKWMQYEEIWLPPSLQEDGTDRAVTALTHYFGRTEDAWASAFFPCAAAMFLRTAWPRYRSTRPSRCSKSTGLDGTFQ